MKTKIPTVFVLLTMLVTGSFAQDAKKELTKKELKEQQKIETQKLVEALVNAREFVFTAGTALPQGGRSVNLTTRPNYMKFHPEMIESDMPYFGRSYTGGGYGGDAGLKYEGKPEAYTVTKKKNNYLIETEVKTSGDTYKITLSVGFQGSTYVTVICSSRSTISYDGIIYPPEKPAETK